MEICTVSERDKVLKNELGRIVEIIKKKYRPEKIVLFGSLTTGRVHEWSDLDLLVIKETKERPIDRCLELGRLTQPKVGIDFFVYTPEEYKLLVRERFSFLIEILKTGKIMYEKRN